MRKLNWIQALLVSEITFYGDYAEVNSQWKAFLMDKQETIFLIRYDWSKAAKNDKLHELRFLYVPNNFLTRLMGFQAVRYPFNLNFR